MDPRVLSALICVIIGGTMVGYSIGYVSVALAWYNVVSNCTGVSSQQACEWVGDAGIRGCTWVPESVTANVTHAAQCVFTAGGNCGTTTNEGLCKADDRCSWNSNSNVCQHVASWDANQQGWIATVMIIGALSATMLGKPFVDHLGLKRSIVITGILAVISTAFVLIGWGRPNPTQRFALLLVYRFINGLAVGFGSMFCPMYVGDVAPEKLAVRIGVCFQVALTFGIMLAAGLGYAFEPKTPTDYADVQRFQVMNGVNMLLSVLMIPMGALIVTPPQSAGSGEAKEELYHLVNPDGEPAEEPFWFTKMMWGGVVLATVQQFCGINAIMNYVPNIATTVGVSNPFLSNFVVMVWNFITTLVAIPIAARAPPHVSYVVGAVIASIACFITGIPTYPGVTDSDDVRNGMVIFGIMLFILAFEFGMGPSFYVLAQSIYPARLRARGCSFTLAMQFLFNIGVNYGFPVLVEAFSGGANGDQKKGLAIMFFLFGAVSMTFIALFKAMGIKRQALEPAQSDLEPTA